MHFIALQTRIGDDSPQHSTDEQTAFILGDTRIDLLVIHCETWKTKSEEDDHRAGAVDLADDRAQIALSRRYVDAAQKIVAAQADDDDARVAGEDIGVDPRQR